MAVLKIALLPSGAILDLGVGATVEFTSRTNRPATWKALIDTGADMTMISPAIASALQPQQIGLVPVSRIGGTDWKPTFDVRVRFGGHGGPGRWFPVEAVEVQPATPDIDILIGMDLLLKIDMAWFGQERHVEIKH